MGSVTALAEHRPHIAVQVGEDRYVIQAAQFRDFIEGKDDLPAPVLREVVREWFLEVTANER